MLINAFHDAAFFPRGERLALEAVDAVVETLLHEVRVHLKTTSIHLLGGRFVLGGGKAYSHEFLHLLPLHAVLQLALLRS